jgi:hypothetical protein
MLQPATISSGTNYDVMPPSTAEMTLCSASTSLNQDEVIFRGLAESWKRETSHFSVLARRYSHPSYGLILGMGAVAIPLILKELQREPDRWFDALERLTKVKPAPDTATFDEAVQCWIAWGRSKNYIS